jgi:hypothetical protein
MTKLALDRASIDLGDREVDPPVKVTLRELALTATGYSNARNARSKLNVRARVGARGRLAWNGELATNPVSAAGRLDVSDIDMVPVRPYVESQVNVSVTAGLLTAKGDLAFAVPDAAPVTASWKGNIVVTEFAALDKPTASDLLRWKRLALDSIDVATEPQHVVIGHIGLEDFYARAIVYQDGTLNLTRLFTPGEEPAPATDSKAAPATTPAPAPARTAVTTPAPAPTRAPVTNPAPAAAPPQAAAPASASVPPAQGPLPITLGGIEFARGNVNYSDFFVQPNYTANLTDFSGTVTNMSADRAGDIAITARVDHTAPVEVSGRISPFAKELSLDIAAKARDIDLPPLTPYAVKYAGYGIEKGKLTFDVHYRVENRKLAAENRLVLDQLTFNPQHIDSPTATKLPVLLAVALLKNTHGVIDIQLPIAGSLDDPKFSVGGLIIRVILNLIAKAATAPFALLAAAFGHGEELSTIAFAPASATVDAEAAKRLDTLGKALIDRPALKLDIGGRADAKVDREAMRHDAVERAMKREKMKSLAARGEAPTSSDLVTIAAEERTRWLTAAYRESNIKDRPRNAIGLLKDASPEEMESMLMANANVDDDALRQLATARAQAVKSALEERKVPGERLFVTAPRLSGEGTAASAKASGEGAESTAAASASRVDLALR